MENFKLFFVVLFLFFTCSLHDIADSVPCLHVTCPVKFPNIEIVLIVALLGPT